MSTGATLRILHLAHRHASVDRLRSQLVQRADEAHTWVFVGGDGKQDADGAWGLPRRANLPDEVRLTSWDAVVVHRMRYPTPPWLLSIPDGPFVVWASWGDDYFRVFPALSRGIHLPASRLLLGVLGKFSVPLLAALQSIRLVLFPRSWRLTPRDWELAAMARADGIVNLFGRGFIALPHLPKVPEFLYSSWYNAVPDPVPDVEASRDPNGPILLGCSASTTGNHLDFIWNHRDTLRHSGRTLRMVLSYGSGRYAKALRLIARRVLRGRMESLDTKVSLDDYDRYLAESPVVVHHHIRNQNTGNAVLSFLMGHRVLMRSESYTYAFFTELGFIVDDASGLPLELTPLDDASRAHNRALALHHFGNAAVIARYEEFTEDLRRVRALKTR